MHLQNTFQLFDLPVERLTGIWRLLLELSPAFVVVGLAIFFGGVVVGSATWILITNSLPPALIAVGKTTNDKGQTAKDKKC